MLNGNFYFQNSRCFLNVSDKDLLLDKFSTVNLNFIKPYYDQLLDEKKLQQIDNLYKDFETPDAASKV